MYSPSLALITSIRHPASCMFPHPVSVITQLLAYAQPHLYAQLRWLNAPRFLSCWMNCAVVHDVFEPPIFPVPPQYWTFAVSAFPASPEFNADVVAKPLPLMMVFICDSVL